MIQPAAPHAVLRTDKVVCSLGGACISKIWEALKQWHSSIHSGIYFKYPSKFEQSSQAWTCLDCTVQRPPCAFSIHSLISSATKKLRCESPAQRERRCTSSCCSHRESGKKQVLSVNLMTILQCLGQGAKPQPYRSQNQWASL